MYNIFGEIANLSILISGEAVQPMNVSHETQVPISLLLLYIARSKSPRMAKIYLFHSQKEFSVYAYRVMIRLSLQVPPAV